MKIFAIAVIAAIAVIPTAAIAQKPPKGGGQNNSNLTVKASANTVTFGQSVTFTGNAKNIAAGTAVEVWENPFPYSGAFKNTGRAGVVDPAGAYTVTGVKPQKHTQYKVIARTSPPVESGNQFVQVRLRVSLRVSDSTPRRGSRVRFYGTIGPEHDGRLVLIQRRTKTGSYVTVARTRAADNGTTTSSKYSRRVRVRSTGVYRVVAQAADQDHLDGTSRTRSLRAN